MQEAINNLKIFIYDQKSYFKLTIQPIVEFNWDGQGYKDKRLNQKWVAESQYSSGLFSCDNRVSLNFTTISTKARKGVYLPGESKVLPKKINMNQEFIDFSKALLLKINYTQRTSIKTLKESTLGLIKLIYIRMFINGDSNPKVMNISSEIIQQAMDAKELGGKGADTVQSSMCSLINHINRLGVTLTPLFYTPTVKKKHTNEYTKLSQIHNNSNFHDCEFANELDEDEDRKLLTIQTFLNLVAARKLVKTDGEKILLNLTMLLLVTGFRFGEARAIRKDSLKRLEVDDDKVVEILQDKGLRTYYLGIEYIGEKKAGQRVHWIEPLAIPLVETIFNDTLKLTQNLRRIYSDFRRTGVKNLLPLSLKDKENIELGDLIKHVTIGASPYCRQRENIQRNFRSFGLHPFHRGYAKVLYHTPDVNAYLQTVASKSPHINAKDFSFNFNDTSTGEIINIPYEELLFIAPLGSLTTGTKLYYPTIATPISFQAINNFLAGKNTLFRTYGLIEENGEFSRMTTHIPRHNINTFLAIAGINDHLQAAMMGRVDINQNDKYQHLAIEERAKANDIIPYEQRIDIRNEINNKTQNLSPIDKIEATGVIHINPKLKAHNGLNQNFHTFTTHKDTINFFEDMINSDIDDITAGLTKAYRLEPSKSQKKALLHCHTTLHALDFGSCMRKIELWSCPYNHKCQDGRPCPYFTLTGRADEPEKLEAKIQTNMRTIKELQELALQRVITPLELTELTEDLNLVTLNLDRLSKLSASLEFPKQPINLIAFDDHKQPKTLATIFAYEHRKLEKQKSKGENKNV
ncbi:hypothetical protein L1D31_13330 [Vibrio sp. Isolate23]|uniref:hypothetical protein n=1 Tax=Vibrio sp. Isolate23 TaxID=2908533 RepID=UPI001EFC5832|nr:hypothetical protein [Vibrio sp. Isolate23]MCG9683552.1 hypothetical protein [Vibrio sp. Isolate23]